MRPFHADRQGGVSARFEPAEVTVLRRFAVEAANRAERVGREADAGVGTDLDPEIARLLPDAYPGDPEASAEFRRFTRASVTERKADNARLMVGSLAGPAGRAIDVRLNDTQAQAWLRALTDIRLALASSLGIEKDGDEGDGHDLESTTRRAIYGWLAAVQETLVRALSRAARH